MRKLTFVLVLSWAVISSGTSAFRRGVFPEHHEERCGYNVENIKQYRSSLSAGLVLAGEGCHVFGPDLPKLRLEVNYDTGDPQVKQTLSYITS